MNLFHSLLLWYHSTSLKICLIVCLLKLFLLIYLFESIWTQLIFSYVILKMCNCNLLLISLLLILFILVHPCISFHLFWDYCWFPIILSSNGLIFVFILYISLFCFYCLSGLFYIILLACWFSFSNIDFYKKSQWF